MRGSLLHHHRRTFQRLRQLATSAVGSKRIKHLFYGCVAFTLLLFFFGASSFLQLKDRRSSSLDRFSATRKGYTLLINTWKRYDLLKQSISHYASCSGLDSIHVVWSEPDPPSNSLIEFLNHVVQLNGKEGRQIELKFDINKEDSLNNRFKEITDLKSDAVFSIDDDVIFPCSSVEFAFNVWLSAQNAMVVFVPRMHWADPSVGFSLPCLFDLLCKFLTQC